MTGLTLSLQAPSTVPLDEALVVVVVLRNEAGEPIRTSSRLNLVEDDLALLVRAPGGGPPLRAGWPWPVDSARREVVLEPRQELVGSALLLSAPSGEPLFPVAGTYSVVAEFTPRPGEAVSSAAVEVARTQPTDEAGRARQRALADPAVVQSLSSLSLMGGAEDGLGLLAGADRSPTAQLLATSVTAVTAALPPAVDRARRRSDPATVSAALVAVLPPGLFPGDERVAVAREALGADADLRARALLTGEPRAAG